MNERIKELAEQAGFRPYYDIGTGKVDADGQVVTLPNWSDTDPWALKYQKFAELVVKECVTKAEQEEDRYFEMGEVDFAYVMKNFQNLLKQDFGVK